MKYTGNPKEQTTSKVEAASVSSKVSRPLADEDLDQVNGGVGLGLDAVMSCVKLVEELTNRGQKGENQAEADNTAGDTKKSAWIR